MRSRAIKLLTAWMKRVGMKPTTLAKHLGVSLPAVMAWLDAESRPRAFHRKFLETFTDGAVPEGAWLSLQEKRRLRAVRPFAEAA